MGRATDAEGRLMSAAAAVEAQEAALRDALVQAMADAEEAAAAGSGSGADPAAEEATEREEAGSDLNGAISTSSGLRQPSRVRVPNAHAHALSAAAAAALAGGVSAVLAAFEEQRARLEARIAAAEAAVSAKEAEAAGLQVWEGRGGGPAGVGGEGSGGTGTLLQPTSSVPAILLCRIRCGYSSTAPRSSSSSSTAPTGVAEAASQRQQQLGCSAGWLMRKLSWRPCARPHSACASTRTQRVPLPRRPPVWPQSCR